VGIPPEARNRIFQSFTQGDGSMTRRFGGTGLGLAICKQLVDLMEGEIGFDTEEGRGSRFWLRIPVETLPEAEAAHPGDASDLAGTRVLVVDDNATSRSILGHYLASWGACVVESKEGEAALHELRRASAASTPFQFVLIDLKMPGMAGTELVRAIRADDSLHQPHLVVFTSAGASMTEWEERELAIASRLTKPARRGELHRALLEALGEHHASKATRSPDPRPKNAGRPHIPGRVLLAEDNEVNQEVAVAMLRALGCEVYAVENGEEVLAQLSRERFDLVFMDCQMPVMDGFAATRAIRAREAERRAKGGAELGRLPIVALTAHAMRHDREECLEAGMDDYLSKPFAREDLRALLEKWLPRERQSSRAAPPQPAEARAQSETTRAPTGEGAPLEATVLEDLRALGKGETPDLFSRVVDAYLESSSQLARSLRDALTAKDPDAMARAAHTLKSSSAQVGARRLAALSKELEALGRAGSLQGARELVAEIGAELEAVQEALAAERFGAGDD
jgi:CheY-like chemotaxis protein/HPt (histidine-containing phosphotransfer) domain-containing protein